jgi:hypothetical protein
LFVVVHNQEVYSTTWLIVDCVQQQQTRRLQYNMTECWLCTTTNKLEGSVEYFVCFFGFFGVSFGCLYFYYGT